MESPCTLVGNSSTKTASVVAANTACPDSAEADLLSRDGVSGEMQVAESATAAAFAAQRGRQVVQGWRYM